LTLPIPISLLVIAYFGRKEATAELSQALIHGLISSTALDEVTKAVQEEDAETLSQRLVEPRAEDVI
jgi:hypothetical protein